MGWKNKIQKLIKASWGTPIASPGLVQAISVLLAHKTPYTPIMLGLNAFKLNVKATGGMSYYR